MTPGYTSVLTSAINFLIHWPFSFLFFVARNTFSKERMHPNEILRIFLTFTKEILSVKIHFCAVKRPETTLGQTNNKWVFYHYFFKKDHKQIFKHLAFQWFRSSHQAVFCKKDVLKSHKYCGSGDLMDVMVSICHLI